MARRDHTLYRNESEKMLGGVCDGIGEYFDIDTTLVRVAFVALAAFGGGGILAYLILWAILDPKPTSPPLAPGAGSTAPDINLAQHAPLQEQPPTPATETTTDTSPEQTPSP